MFILQLEEYYGNWKLPLPGEKLFSQKENKYNKSAFAELCQEFNLPPNPDFRWMDDANQNPAHRFPLLYKYGAYQEILQDLVKAHGGKQYEWFSPESRGGFNKTRTWSIK